MHDPNIATDAVAQFPELEPAPSEEQPDYSDVKTTETRDEWRCPDAASGDEDRIEFTCEVMDLDPPWLALVDQDENGSDDGKKE
jgi:hypothetical protein